MQPMSTYTGLTEDALRTLTGLELAPVDLQSRALLLADKSILVTGAGGAIGAALAKAIASCAPSRLILLDASEHGLYEIDRDLRELDGSVEHVSTLGSVCDHGLMSALFDRYQPQIVFHAAAFKHVPLLEQNPFAAIANNVLATYLVAQAAISHRAEHLILVSTDKAVDPLSLMGASKRIAELILLTLQQGVATRMRAVRLGNVLGSKGSVVPLFLDQIDRSGPVTVTHPEARRYFMTIQDAVQALLSALSPEYTASTLVPKLGRQIRIADLALSLIQTRCKGDSSVPIRFTALRPGDKMAETLLSSCESWMPGAEDIANSRVLRSVQSPGLDLRDLLGAIDDFGESLLERNLDRLMRTVLRLVPEYQPSSLLCETIECWEQSMEAYRT